MPGVLITTVCGIGDTIGIGEKSASGENGGNMLPASVGNHGSFADRRMIRRELVVTTEVGDTGSAVSR